MSSHLKSHEKQLQTMLKTLLSSGDESERLNQQASTHRPTRIFDEEMERWQIRTMEKEMLDNSKRNQQLVTVTSGTSFVCKTPFEELKPITLNEMKVPMVHRGRYLLCRSIVQPLASMNTDTLIQDLNDDVEEVAFFNFSYNIKDTSWIPSQTVMIIKEPYLQYGAVAQQISLRVDSPSDVIFIDSTDLVFLEKLNAQKWYVSSTKDVDKIREQGNELVKQKDYNGALKLYNRAIRYNPEVPVLYLNKAFACLRSGYFNDAYEAAKIGMEKGGDREKALYRMGLAAYGKKDWPKAVDDFTTLINEFPNNKDATRELNRSMSRLDEQNTGNFDFKTMYLESKKDTQEFEIADFTGPVEIVKVPRKRWGVIATKDIKKGDLLVVSKSFATGRKEDIPYSLMNGNLIQQRLEGAAQKLQIIRTVENLKKDPQKAKIIYALYAGDLPQDEEYPEGIIDVSRIEHISTYNSFRIDNFSESEDDSLFPNLHQKAVSLFVLPSYFNHSCLANTYRVLYSDVMVIYAIADIKQGDELTLAYTDPLEQYDKRHKIIENSWKFECKCRLCEIDHNDTNYEKRIQLLDEFFKLVDQQLDDHSKGILKGKALLKQIRDSYANRNEYKVTLAESLIEMGTLHGRSGDIAMNIECATEAIELLDDKFGLYAKIPDLMLKVAFYYTEIGRNRESSEWANKAFKSSLCVDKEHFKMRYPDASLFSF